MDLLVGFGFACLGIKRLIQYMKVLFIVDPPVQTALEAELRPRFESRATVTKTEPEYIEFLHPTVNKGAGLKGLCDSLGISMHRVMAIGDADNDEPMVALAGWGVGVANANERVRRVAASLTVADCNHDGVGEAIERWVLP